MTDPSWVPPSGEVLAEEIQVNLAAQGVPREEQGEIIALYARVVGNEIAELTKLCIEKGNE